MQVNSSEKLEHALLYSITVNLPAHRMGQLDSVLVLASPINDINLHAWDLNRIQRFLRLDIGIRVELCTQCLRSSQEASITFIMEKIFIKDCIKFLCLKARIDENPENENGFLVYRVPHQCFYITPPTEKAPPPPYSEGTLSPNCTPQHDYDIVEFIEAPPSAPPEQDNPSLPCSRPPPQKPMRPVFQFPDGVWGDYSSGCRSSPSKNQPPSIPPASFTESGVLSDSGVFTETSGNQATNAYLPPRTIPRRNHATSIPATHSYSNVLQPHIFDNSAGNFSLESPYQINSRIIFTDDGDVQYEQNILGNTPHPSLPRDTAHLFMRSIPLPPRNRAREVGGDKEGVATAEGGVGTSGEAHGETVASSARLESGETDIDIAWEDTSFVSPSTPNWDHTHNVLSHGCHRLEQSENHASSLVTTLFSTQLASPTSHQGNTPTPSSVATRRRFAATPPPLFSRTSSDTRRGNHPRDRGQRRPSFVSYSTANSHASQSPTNDYDEDCYVLVTPSSSSYISSTSTSSLSPSYVKEDQLLAIIGAKRVGATSAPPAYAVSPDYKSFNDVFEDSDSSQLSLVEAGNVIREDWLCSLQQLRLSQERSISETRLPPNDMGLDEVAYLEYSKNRRSGCLSCGDYVDERSFVVSPHSRYGGTHWRMGSSSDEEDVSLLVDFDGAEIKLQDDTFPNQAQKRAPPVERNVTPESRPPKVEVESSNQKRDRDCSYHHRPRSQYITKKPEIRPRRKARNAASMADFNSKTCAQSQSIPSTDLHFSSSDVMSPKPPKSEQNSHYSASVDYVQSSIPVSSLQKKPVPAPRTAHTLAVKSSANASMVTMAHWSSSESNLLDSVLNERLTTVGRSHWQEETTLCHKFHSSTEINTL